MTDKDKDEHSPSGGYTHNFYADLAGAQAAKAAHVVQTVMGRRPRNDSYSSDPEEVDRHERWIENTANARVCRLNGDHDGATHYDRTAKIYERKPTAPPAPTAPIGPSTYDPRVISAPAIEGVMMHPKAATHAAPRVTPVPANSPKRSAAFDIHPARKPRGTV